MTQASNSALGEIQLAGDLAGSNSATAPALTATGVTAGSYTVPTLTIDAKGRVTSATSGTLTNATTSVKGIVQVGSNIDVSAGVISVATATDTVKGILQVTNGNGLSLTSGTLSSTLTNATTSVKGIVQVGSNIDVSAGVISVATATDTVKGILQVTNGNGLSLTSGTLSFNISNNATTSTYGIVQIGTNIDVSSGIISVANASGTTVKGIVKSGNASNLSIVDGVIDISATVLSSSVQNTFTKSQATALVTITDAATITPDLSLSNVQMVTLAGNRTFASPTGSISGGQYLIAIKQDATGSRTVTFHANYIFRSGQSSTLTTTANKTDIISITNFGGVFLCDFIKGF